jgi:hypothetical protein
VRQKDDPKLAALAEELVRIVRQAEKEGIDADDVRRKRKVLLFSFYEDTIDWVEQFVRARVERTTGWRRTAVASRQWPATRAGTG